MNTIEAKKICEQMNKECPGLVHTHKMEGKLWTVDKEHEIFNSLFKNKTNAIMMVRLNKIFSQVTKWKTNFPNIEPYYAIKCNPSIPIIKFLAHCGIGFDCATIREIKQVLSENVSPNKIIYAHPVKHVENLKECKSLGINFTVVDSVEEVRKIKQYNPEMKFLIRLKIGNKNSKISLSDKFGATLEFA